MTNSPEPVGEPPPEGEPPNEPGATGPTGSSTETTETSEPAAAEPTETPEPSEQSEPPGSTELRDRWRRALADLDNLRKRHAKELSREREAERARVCTDWLPVLDNLELALTHAGSDTGSVVQGVRAVRDQAVDVLHRLGYPRDDETGVPFDPLRHEVVTVVDEPGTEPGTVVQCLRPGYGTPGHQLRPMAAVVSKRQE
ncbi:nucleotide exchange factor GrpE [Streptomyces sp. NP-1717]|uniref:nucleotide exchange factor GrpE n=1 Tax=Streptomyces sp. NP-1717 TaxID=2704470 RepID=UPI001F5C4F89|nr:nucleotide exchange factor GrpE [Streptomyces sp. NP-1717]MCI3220650.1 nucleotide exchange factor GrpE [Streptomyces sp. NP-1717]